LQAWFAAHAASSRTRPAASASAGRFAGTSGATGRALSRVARDGARMANAHGGEAVACLAHV